MRVCEQEHQKCVNPDRRVIHIHTHPHTQREQWTKKGQEHAHHTTYSQKVNQAVGTNNLRVGVVIKVLVAARLFVEDLHGE